MSNEAVSQEVLLEAVEEQANHANNILCVIKALKVAAGADTEAGWVEGALELLEGSIDDLCQGLETHLLVQAALDKQEARGGGQDEGPPAA